MKEYPKIQTVFKRDPETKFKTLLMGQHALPEFRYLDGNVWQFTEKVDGTNIRVGYDRSMGMALQGRTAKSEIQSSLQDAIYELLPEQKLEKVFLSKLEEETSVILYGEGYGPKIQKGGGNYRKDQSFVLFDVRIGNWWLKREDVDRIAEDLGIESVPIIGEGNLVKLVNMVQAGFSSRWGDFLAEGIVARPKVELFARDRQRIITKLKYKDFIHEEE